VDDHACTKTRADFPTRVALLWQKILRSDHADAFAGTVGSAIDRSHGHDRLPQPGFVGSRYQPQGVLILGQNPGNDAIGKGESAADLHQYEMLRRLRDAVDTASAVAASKALMAALGSTVMPTWLIVQNVVRPLLAALNLTLDDIAYTNLVKFRTSGSSFASRIYDRSWVETSGQICLLEPSVIIALGNATHDQFKRRYKGPARHFRVQRCRGDTRIPDEGRRDIERIAAQLNRDTPRVSGAMSPTRILAAAAQANRDSVSVNSTRVVLNLTRPNSTPRLGNYKIVDLNALLKRASKRDDPRWEFYNAMMKLSRYEDYYITFGDMRVYPKTYRSSARTAHTEMAWARKQGWIADA
jgi:hypothetical protein